jgi:deoxyhypusine synthase
MNKKYPCGMPTSTKSGVNKAEKAERMDHSLHDGFEDGFEPLVSLDLESCKDFDELTQAMSKTMVIDPDCFVMLSLSGAMTPAKMGLIMCDMIDLGMVNAVVSTGALMTHGFVEAQGMSHFKYKFGQMNDAELYSKGYDRIYDVLELEKNLDDTEFIFREVMKNMDPDKVLCSQKILQECGKWLTKHTKGRGILKSAFDKKVPVYVPAFTDSEMGLDFGILNIRRQKHNKKQFQFDPYLDLNHFALSIQRQKTMGIFTIGGGVPRNWTQQVAPYLDIMQKRVENECPQCESKGCDNCNGKGFVKDVSQGINRYKYGVRVCPEPVHWGGLSGCTYSEGVTWGKFVPASEGGMFSEVLCDATIAWPLIMKAVIDRLKKEKKLGFVKEKQRRLQASILDVEPGVTRFSFERAAGQDL